ncbi:DUF2892 domain-containing protein [uncultured Thiodictyon sp.]|uniref:YgaP family membrane protein n=1 Tax=uncultured Thiodictyon sp. TaxID=1846217 RepID=UPI0025DDAD5C|nr:DUF2892 domain-containing protein [uncultured Thiodictyon sp.]
MSLKKNVGQTDRNIRLAAAGVLVLGGVWSNLWFLSVIGLILLITSLTGFCLAYVPFKIDTNRDGED